MTFGERPKRTSLLFFNKANRIIYIVIKMLDAKLASYKTTIKSNMYQQNLQRQRRLVKVSIILKKVLMGFSLTH